jgi:hypothetical protein
MESYGFKQWYSEGMWDKLKSVGRALGTWSPVTQQTMHTYPSRYVEPTQPTQQPQKKTVGFRISDMDNLKVAITDYLGLISRFLTVMHKQVPYPTFMRAITNRFETEVGPAYRDLYTKIKWINDMNALARSQYESTELLEEAVKINYKRFEELVAAMRNLAMALKYWVYDIVKRLPDAQGQRLKAIYDQNILRQQAFVGRQVQWLQSKLQQLMAANNIPYRQI